MPLVSGKTSLPPPVVRARGASQPPLAFFDTAQMSQPLSSPVHFAQTTVLPSGLTAGSRFITSLDVTQVAGALGAAVLAMQMSRIRVLEVFCSKATVVPPIAADCRWVPGAGGSPGRPPTGSRCRRP